MTITTSFDEYSDTIDTRDIVSRIEELEGDDETTDEEREELADLVAFAEELRGCCGDDLDDGNVLVAESYFEDYARELAEELSLIPEEYTWPTSCIDWEQAASELQMDYTAVEWRGVTFWTR